MPSRLRGFGLALPEHSIAQADAAEFVRPFNADTEEQARVLRGLYRRAGVRRRHSVVLESSDDAEVVQQSTYLPRSAERPLGPTTSERMRAYEQHASLLATSATRRALSDAAIEAADITHLVTVSCSGFHAPGFDIELLQMAGLSPSVARTHVGFMGCHGALNGLRVADAFLKAEPNANVLLCCVELCSLHHQYGWSPDRIVSNALFADGAAAVVLTSSRSRETSDRTLSSSATSGIPPDSTNWQLLASGSVVLPGTLDDMGWRIRDHGFEMTLSARVPEIIKQHLRPWLSDWLGSRGVSLDDIRTWAFHPGGPRILSAAGEALGLQREQWAVSESVLAEFGNMSSPTILFILDRLRSEAVAGSCVALAFGPGLTIEAALLSCD
ncbi:MAG: type III polyketide synthase [Planctomycetaceae bacterium]